LKNYNFYYNYIIYCIDINKIKAKKKSYSNIRAKKEIIKMNKKVIDENFLLFALLHPVLSLQKQ